MNHSLITPELVETINEERARQAELRRIDARRHITSPRSQSETMRMALGPGTQFAGVTEQILDTVAGRSRSLPRSA